MSTDKDFETAIEEVLKSEGGYVNDPLDLGGETNLGITLKFMLDKKDYELFDIENDGDIDKIDLKKLDKERAKLIYRKYFWDNFSLDLVESGKIAYLIFDMVINHGPGILKRVKRVLNDLYEAELDETKGTIDGDTLYFLNTLDVDELIDVLLSFRERYYKEITIKRPANQKFLKGWLNRVKHNREVLVKFEN